MNYCYILKAKQSTKSYNGYTNNLERRIRQHCGELVGGAKFTTKHAAGWEYIAQITSNDQERFNQKAALSLEWHIRYPKNKRPRAKEFNGPEGRIKGLNPVFQWAQTKFGDLHFDVYIDAAYIDLLQPQSNITIHTLTNTNTNIPPQQTSESSGPMNPKKAKTLEAWISLQNPHAPNNGS